MSGPKTSRITSPGLARVAERARKDPGQQRSLAHHLTVEVLEGAFERIRTEAAPGVDGVTKEEYGKARQANLQDLHARLRSGRYRHQPIRRTYIPKERGGQRPLGIPTVEDKIVQRGLAAVLEAVYEPTFLECSYGFRPGRGCHGALRTLQQATWGGITSWILEIDIKSFFDSLDRPTLMEMLQERIADKSLLRLVGKCLNAGILEGAEFARPEVGTPQGSALSPLLGNIYLHYALDTWFERTIKPTLRGRAMLVRYADDAVFGFERREDAEQVLQLLGPRLAACGLQLEESKTRLVDFRRPTPSDPERRPGTFDFLGFTAYWRRSRRGRWYLAYKTRRARLNRAVKAVAEWCRGHRHLPVRDQHEALTRRIRGHYAYFGVNGNVQALSALYRWATRSWFKWLNRRSQRSRLTWERYCDLLKGFPLPAPRVYVQIWG